MKEFILKRQIPVTVMKGFQSNQEENDLGP